MAACSILSTGHVFYMKFINLVLICIINIFIAGVVYGKDDYYLHDAHIHYSKDMWEILPPEQAIKMLKDANIKHALVSATPTEGAEKLYREDAQLVVPMLRPYKSWRHRFTWFNDPQLKKYLLEHLAKIPYRGIGEFHVFGKDAGTPAIEEMISLARTKKLPLHAHTDLEGMQIILQKAQGVVVIWAHGGFDVPLKTLKSLVEANPKFYIELSYREGMLDEQGDLLVPWKAFLNQYSKRFLVGMDTYKPSRWAALAENAQSTQHWLKQLSEESAQNIASRNFNRLFR